MNRANVEMEGSVARCRVFLALVTILAIYLDPTKPALTRWLPLTGGLFVVNRYWVTVALAYLAFSLAIAAAQSRAPRKDLATIATCGDVLFGAAIALVTEAETSLYNVFFAFAVLSVGLRSGRRAAFGVTAASLLLYTVLILTSAPSQQHYYVMRAAYLGLIGYVVGYLGQERLDQDLRIRALETTAQREQIARSLHDGYAQSLAGINLRLGSCQELLRRDQRNEAMLELSELQAGVNREHDELRAYIHSLIDHDRTSVQLDARSSTRFFVRADFAGSFEFVEHVFQIMLEGTRNVRRHASARSAAIHARAIGEDLVIDIDDDGVGFPRDVGAPWSIASRVAESGGEVRLYGDRGQGGHVHVEIPVS
ncbi:MAG TPA: histidine kinase [Candidatus Binatia bacterium]|nr:histidine kinase [Candidatus Binatia bacterium]